MKSYTTFANDFAIANLFGKNAIRETFNNGTLYAKTNYKAAAELCIVTNVMAWKLYEEELYELSRLYSGLYHESRDLYFDTFSENQDAMDYYMSHVD